MSSFYNVGLNEIEIPNSPVSCNKIQNDFYLCYMDILEYFKFSLSFILIYVYSYLLNPFPFPFHSISQGSRSKPHFLLLGVLQQASN